jgi:hypothetical protein
LRQSQTIAGFDRKYGGRGTFLEEKGEFKISKYLLKLSQALK